MARIIYTGIVSSINGSVAGTTFQRNRYGSTVKGKPITVNPNWPKQNVNKLLLQACVTKWRNLSIADRAAWNNWATVNPVPSRLNPASFLNGFNLFISWHMTEGLFLPGTTLNNPSLALGSISAPTMLTRNVGANMRFDMNYTLTAGVWLLALFASGPVTVSSYLSSNPTRFMDVGPANAGGLNLLASPQYQNTFGGLAPVGSYVITEMVFINQNTAQIVASPPLRTIVTV